MFLTIISVTILFVTTPRSKYCPPLYFTSASLAFLATKVCFSCCCLLIDCSRCWNKCFSVACCTWTSGQACFIALQKKSQQSTPQSAFSQSRIFDPVQVRPPAQRGDHKGFFAGTWKPIADKCPKCSTHTWSAAPEPSSGVGQADCRDVLGGSRQPCYY